MQMKSESPCGHIQVHHGHTGLHGHEQACTHVHGHGHGHAHSHVPALNARNQRSVLWALGLTVAFMLLEVAGGLYTGSLALLADAGHMLTDAVALALAWAGFHFGRGAATARKTFGYVRLEVLAALFNAMSLFLLSFWIAWEAIVRLQAPGPVLGGPMLLVALAGLLVNLAVFALLRRADTAHINIQGAMLHVLGDMLGSIAALLAALVIRHTGWVLVDPILSLLILLLILRSAWGLLRNALDILLEGVPPGLDIAHLADTLVAQVQGLSGVSHVHVWSLSSGLPAATLEACIEPQADPQAVLAAIKRELGEGFGIAHSTVEIVWAPGQGCNLEAARGQG